MKSAYDWFHAGQPSFAAVAGVRMVGAKQEMSVRLSASDPLHGSYTTVMASTELGSGADALALSAERAAYKLLYRLTAPTTPTNDIEGHAALRQGIGLLAAYARAENGTAQERKIGLKKAVTNLDFASQMLRGDGSKTPWPEVLRYRALACFVTSDLVGAMHSLQQIQDTKWSQSPRKDVVDWLSREARHNLAVVLMRLGGMPNLRAAQVLFSTCIGASVPNARLDGTTVSAHFGRVAALAALDSSEWSRLHISTVGTCLRESWAALKGLSPDTNSTPADQRRVEFVAAEFERTFGMAWSRYLFAQRGDRRIATPADPEDTKRTNEACRRLGDWLRTHIGGTREYVSYNYLALVNLAYVDAHTVALKAIAIDPKNEFAHYLAAEALSQNGNKAAAEAMATSWQDQVTEPTFRALGLSTAPGASPSRQPRSEVVQLYGETPPRFRLSTLLTRRVEPEQRAQCAIRGQSVCAYCGTALRAPSRIRRHECHHEQRA